MLLHEDILNKRFALLIENLHEGILVENEERRIILTNDAFCKMFGFSVEPHAMIGFDCSNAAEDSKGFFSDPEGFVARIAQILDAKTKVIGDELETVTGLYLERDYIPVIIDNNYLGHVWKYRDITEKKQFLLAKQKLIDDLEELNHTKDMLFSIIAHDFRGPLSSLISYLDHVVEKSTGNFKIDRDLSQLLSQSESVLQMTTNMLVWAKQFLDHKAVNRVPVNLRKLVETEFGLIKYAARQKEVTLVNSIPDNRVLTSDIEVLGHVVRNLLSNALKFSHESGFIFVEPHGDSGFKVRDNGVGMAPDMVEQLLDSNTFAPGKGTSGEKGMGIGMQIVNTMCKKIGGILTIESQLGKGTTIYVGI